MAWVPQSFADWKKVNLPTLQAAVINTIVAENPLLSRMPMQAWPGGKSHRYAVNSTLPTISNITETTQLEATASTRFHRQVQLAQFGGQISVPVFLDATMSNDGFSPAAEELADLVRAYAQHWRTQLITGGGTTEASVTIHAEVIVKGVNVVVEVSPGMPQGYGALSYDDTAQDSWQFRAPGDEAFGTAVDVETGGDGTYQLFSADVTKWVRLTFDVSDAAAGGDYSHGDALLFPRPATIDGLQTLVSSTSNSAQLIGSTGANGDAISLATLDHLDDLCLGPNSEKAYIVNPRTRRSLKTLLGAAGGNVADTWMGLTLEKDTLTYEGKPIISCPDVPITEAKGSLTTGGSVYLVRFNMAVGVGMFFAPQSNGFTPGLPTNADDDVIAGNTPLPVYLRRIAIEREEYAEVPYRITGGHALFSKRTNSISRAAEITD